MEMHGLIKKAFTKGWAYGTFRLLHIIEREEDTWKKNPFLTSERIIFIAKNWNICKFWSCLTTNEKKNSKNNKTLHRKSFCAFLKDKFSQLKNVENGFVGKVAVVLKFSQEKRGKFKSIDQTHYYGNNLSLVTTTVFECLSHVSIRF